jgi:hypothetical protein
MSSWCSFLDLHSTQTNRGVQAIVVVEVVTSSTLKFVLREGLELVNESGMVAFMQIRLPLDVADIPFGQSRYKSVSDDVSYPKVLAN